MSVSRIRPIFDCMKLKYGNLVIPLKISAGSLVFDQIGEFFEETFSEVRDDLFQKTGFIVPSVELAKDPSLGKSEYFFYINGVNKVECISKKGESLRENFTDALRSVLEENFLDLLSTKTVGNMLKDVSDENPEVVEQVINEFGYTREEIKKVLFSLLMEKISIKNIVLILESLPQKTGEFSLKKAIEEVRKRIAPELVMNRIKNGSLQLIQLSPEDAEYMLSAANDDEGDFPYCYPSFVFSNEDEAVYIQEIHNAVLECYENEVEPVLVVPEEIRFETFDFMLRNDLAEYCPVISIREFVEIAKKLKIDCECKKISVKTKIEYLKKIEAQAEKGDETALELLCRKYKSGEEENPQKYLYWLTKWAETGNVNAMQKLYLCYFTEKSLKDDEKGFYWLKKCAEAGHKDSYPLLAAAYKEGIGTQRNLKLAEKWGRG